MRLALKTRPDVAAVTGSIVCKAKLNPVLATKLAVAVWRYLLHNKGFGLCYEAASTGMSGPVSALGDTSLGVGASRSRTGALITWGKHVISWKSTRQSITAWSAFEAEADAGACALEVGLRIRGTLEALIGTRPETTLLEITRHVCQIYCGDIMIIRLLAHAILACGVAGFGIRLPLKE